MQSKIRKIPLDKWNFVLIITKFLKNPMRERSAQKHSLSDDVPSRFSKPAMRCDKVGRCQTITIHENQILTGCRLNSSVTNGRQPESIFRMPNMFGRQITEFLLAFDDTFRPFIRAVIGNNDLKISIRLSSQRAQRKSQIIRFVVGRNNHGDESFHDLSSSPMTFCAVFTFVFSSALLPDWTITNFR